MMAHSTHTQAEGGLVNVVLQGHRYVRRLREYATRSLSTANLGLSGIQVRYVCLGGMTLRPRLRGGSRGVPIPTDMPPSPEHILSVIACECRTTKN